MVTRLVSAGSSPAAGGRRPGRAAILARPALLGAALLTLGALLGTAGDALPHRALAVALALVAVALLGAEAGATRRAGVLVGISAVGLALVAGDATAAILPLPGASALLAAALAVALLLAPPLWRLLVDAAALLPLRDDLLPEALPAPLGTLIEREVARARRTGRPFTVVSVSVAAPSSAARIRRAHVLALARAALERSLRHVDLVGAAGGLRLAAVLVEAGRDERARVIGRLRADLERAGLTIAGMGAATFPDDSPTWTGLEELARSREALEPGDWTRGVAARIA